MTTQIESRKTRTIKANDLQVGMQIVPDGPYDANDWEYHFIMTVLQIRYDNDSPAAPRNEWNKPFHIEYFYSYASDNYYAVDGKVLAVAYLNGDENVTIIEA